ncbi:stage II sporulation protein M [archaeon]|nr:stage II sporulation protein M [archaeon]
MVLEAIMNPFQAEKHPIDILLLGVVYAAVSLFLALWVFENQAGLVTVFLTVLACVPLFYHTMIFEEQKSLKINSEWRLMREHGKAFLFFTMLFIGITIGYTFLYVVLPSSSVEKVFSVQIETINNINGQVNGNFIGTAFQQKLFSQIVLNNIKVMIFSLFFSLLYGSGSIFILVWNSSVISAAFGNFIRTYVSYLLNILQLDTLSAYTKVVSLSVLRYSIHGIPEILSYFIAGLAGGILSVAVIRKDFNYKKFEKIMFDFTNLVVLALIVVIISGLLEVYVTPIVFQNYHQAILTP